MKKRLLSAILMLCIMLTILPKSVSIAEEAPRTDKLTVTTPNIQSSEIREDSLSSDNVALITKSNLMDSLVPLTKKNSASGTCGENLVWYYADHTLTIEGTGDMISSYEAEPWWIYREDVETLIIKKGVTSISDHAFDGFTSLVNITISDSVTSIGRYSFCMCTSLTNITIPNSITCIADWAFGCTNLSNITIPDNVTTIGNYAFCECTNLANIVIPNNVAYIGTAAFAYCNLLTDVYYKSSNDDWKSIEISDGNECLTNATIHYEKNQEYKIYHGSGFPDGYEIFDVSLENCIKQKPTSSDYNPQLAHMLIAMCNSVHNENDMNKTFDNLGFEKKLRADLLPLTFSVGVKQTEEGETLVLIVARGTTDVEEIITDFRANANKEGLHSGFSDAAYAVYDETMEFLAGNNIDVEKAKFVITGHSLGAAAINILSAKLVDDRGLDQKNIYTYTFACPDVAVITEKTANSESYKHIFNISNVKDFVSWLPRAIWSSSGEKDGHGKDTYWNKYGQSYWFCEDWNDYQALKTHALSIPEFHFQDKYLLYLRSEKPISEYRQRSAASSALDDAANKREQEFLKSFFTGKVTRIRSYCPVNLEIYTSDGQLIGKIANGIAEETISDKVYISINGDKKNIYLLDNKQAYIIKLNGTDNGTMEYAIENIDINSWKIIEEKTFANVALNNSKRMISYINPQNDNEAGIDIPNVPLFILDDNDKVEKEVLSDGNGTEVPIIIKYSITFNAMGGIINQETMKTNADGKLSDFPTPTRTGYTFVGWFTEDTAGTQITTDTTFTSDTIIYAHWAHNNETSGLNNWAIAALLSFACLCIFLIFRCRFFRTNLHPH